MKFSNEFILPHVLNNTQHQIMIGGLLGDSSLEKGKNSKYPRLKIDRQFIDKPYLEWQFSHFKDLCKSEIKEISRFDIRYDKYHKQVSFRTRAIPAFLDYYNKWYFNGIKIIPYDLEFSPLILAVWFCDDGCIINNNNLLTLKLSTESFGYDNTFFLAEKLTKLFDSSFPVYRKRKDKKQFFIKTSTVSAKKFLKYILPELQFMGMNRKLDIFQGVNLNQLVTVPSHAKYNSLAPIILNLNSFTIKELKKYQIYNNHRSLICVINRFYKLKYFTREETVEIYKYTLTDSGRNFFTNLMVENQQLKLLDECVI